MTTTMPELPEVQTIVNQLKENLVGKIITGIDIRMPKMFSGSRDQVLGSRIIDVRRRAKMILIKLDHEKNLVVHLKMTGQLIYGKNESNKSNKNNKSSNKNEELIYFPNPIPFAGMSLPGKTTHIIFNLNDGSKLFFNDMRQFGWVKLLTDEEVIEVHEKHGPEPFDSAYGHGLFTVEYLAKILANWGRPVKLLLLDQSKIAGIGNIYANEALWYAEISPMKRGRDIPKEKIPYLHTSIIKVLKMGLEYGGSSASDEAFVNAEGLPGKMQEHFMVYQKNGTACPRCGKTITRSTIGGRGTFFCPKCQK